MAPQEEEGTKVFVGNLTYETTEQELSNVFGEFGNLLKVTILKRKVYNNNNNKSETPVYLSKGFGFITFQSKQEAETAITKMDKQELNGRSINVQLATPLDQKPTQQQTRVKNTNNSNAHDTRHNNNNNNNNSEITTNENTESNDKRKKRDMTNAVFVSNLPFSFKSSDLKEFFVEAGFKVTEAHIAINRINGRTRSKGFGFVHFDSESDQLRAVDEINGKQVGEREIVVKVAVQTRQD